MSRIFFCNIIDCITEVRVAMTSQFKNVYTSLGVFSVLKCNFGIFFGQNTKTFEHILLVVEASNTHPGHTNDEQTEE